jgi:hypothetical protein
MNREIDRDRRVTLASNGDRKMALLLASLFIGKWLLHVDFLPVGDKKEKAFWKA